MTREEWDALPGDSKPAIRLCLPVAGHEDQTRLAPAAIIRSCAWCRDAIWIDDSQELPAEGRELGVITVCESCVMTHHDLAVGFIKNIADVYLHYLQTGVIKAINIKEE